MQSAILRGLYDIRISPAYNCSGNCSWNVAQVSLGFKTSCDDVTSLALSTRICVHEDSIFTCNMTTPKGIQISTVKQPTNYRTSFSLVVSSETEVQLPSLFKVAVYRISSNFSDDSRPLQEDDPKDIEITECALELKAFRYLGANATGSSFQFQNVIDIDLPQDAWSRSDEAIPEKIYYYTNQSDSQALPRLEIGHLDIMTMRNYYKSDMISSQWLDGGGIPNRNYGISAALMGQVDIATRFDRMAAEMTDRVRSGPNEQAAYGSATEQVPYVFVRWLWLIGPGALEAAAILFAALTLMQNRTGFDTLPWKSSALAVLACEHVQDSNFIYRKTKDIGKIEGMAKVHSVRLE